MTTNSTLVFVQPFGRIMFAFPRLFFWSLPFFSTLHHDGGALR